MASLENPINNLYKGEFLLLQSIGFKYTGFSSCDSGAQMLCGMQNLPGPGIEPSSPALAGRFLSPTNLFLNET